MAISVRLLGQDEAHVLDRVAPDVFDTDIDPAACADFFADPRHHIAIALDGDTVVGIASALQYLHPDKPNEYWINEVGVAPSHQRRGIGTSLLELLLEHARSLGCKDPWLATEQENTAARGLYSAIGGKEHRAVYVTFGPGTEDT